MIVSVKDLPDSARVWVYQANKDLNEDLKKIVEEESANFCKQWTAHGANLMAGYQVINNRFLVLAIDEEQNSATGCSIDSSVHFVTALGIELDIDFLDRETITFLENDKVINIPMFNLKDEVEQGKIKPGTITFNLQAKNIADLKENWLVPAEKTWMKKYFK